MTSPIYLIRLIQVHESFRLPELKVLSRYIGVDIDILEYSPASPFCLIRFLTATPQPAAVHHAIAKDYISRAIIARGIYELWGRSAKGSYEELHADVRARTSGRWRDFDDGTFKFGLDTYCGKRSSREQTEIIEGFAYLGFKGKIRMRDPDEEFVVFEGWDHPHHLAPMRLVEMVADGNGNAEGVARVTEPTLRHLFLGRFVGGTKRWLIDKHDLKKRPYISTTSMDAELALITATLAKAGPGRMFLDPFVGTGGFMVAAAELGALTFGSDIDGRSFRGKGQGMQKGVLANFNKYAIRHNFGDCFTSDLTHSPLRKGSFLAGGRWLDGILCDPPYGVREGLKVLGRRLPTTDELPPTNANSRRATNDGPYMVDGKPSHTLPGFVAPKRPYSFTRMLDDILAFAAETLVDGGRLAFWMPTANEAEEDFPTPLHACLELKHVCVQSFNKWSRKLLVYERKPGEMSAFDLEQNGGPEVKGADGRMADDLNHFRKRYFQGFANGSTAK